MTDIDLLFFELIQVAIGNRKCLSHTPSADEWGKLYAMAEKQALVGVCFAGVEWLHEQRQVPPMELLMDWLGQAEYIRSRNEAVNKQCVELQHKLAKDGFSSSILKGQGVGALYGEKLSMLRQSGDIDIFVDGGIERAFEYCKEHYGNFEYDYINAHIPEYDDTEVELHWRVHSLPNPFANKRLQKWFMEHESELHCMKITLQGGSDIIVPSPGFNLFFILLHCYHHMFESGLGLRQLMDYYFVLRMADKANVNNGEVLETIQQFGMARFASGVMWIMQRVFVLPDEYLLCIADEQEGSILLKEIMRNGNFGHYDDRRHSIRNKWIEPFVTRLQHNWHLVSRYPTEFIWSPVWLLWHFAWKRNWKNNHN